MGKNVRMEETQYLDTAEDNGQDRQIAGWILLCGTAVRRSGRRMQSEGSLSSAEHQALCGRLGNGGIDRAGNRLQLEPRSNSLVRPPLANLDQLVLVVSIADPAPNAFVLDKLIAIAEYQQIEPVIVITKCDLADPKEFTDIYRKAGFAVYETRTLEHQGIQEVMEMLKDKTSAFCGNSGAGKSTLLNAIDPRLSLDTGDISQKLGRGRHTTRHVELFELPQGGFVADTPGFSAVDLEKFQTILKDELADCFREMHDYEGKCRFRGCSHTKEAGCAVLQAVKDGEISQSRHQSYLNLYEQAKNIKEWELDR